MSTPRPLSCIEVDELSGLFVLDALEPAEAEAVSAHLAACPEAHAAFTELTGSSAALAGSVDAVDMPAGSRARVMAAVAATPQVPDGPGVRSGRDAAGSGLRADGPAGHPAPVRAPQPPSAREPFPTTDPAGMGVAPQGPWLGRLRGGAARRAWAWSGMAAAAIAILLIGVGILGAIQQQSAQTERLELLRQAVAAASDPGTNVAVLTGSEALAGSAGYAVFPDGAAGYIVVDGLPAAGSDRAYQAWFVGGGEATSAGLLTLADDGLGTLTGLEPVAGTEVIALTVEERPGAEAPTRAPVLAGELRFPVDEA